MAVIARSYYVTVCRGCGIERDNPGVCPDCRDEGKRVIEVVPASQYARYIESSFTYSKQLAEAEDKIAELQDEIYKLEFDSTVTVRELREEIERLKNA